MAYKNFTIAESMDLMDNQTLLLPIIQRNYVWDEKQIEKLFDSIMCDYPFGTFVFWNVKKEVANENKYKLYKFVKDFHERDTYNDLASQPFTMYETNKDHPNDYIYAVLDGQQRLTSLYISLKGSLRRKILYKRWEDDNSFPRKELYFDLDSDLKEDETGITYKFKFLTDDEYKNDIKNVKWFKVKDILSIKDDDKLTDYISNNYNNEKNANRNLRALYKRMKVDELITFYELKNDSQDDTLDIFVRINSAGTILSKTDFLFSKIVLRWNDGREEIEQLIKKINKINNGYSYSTDFIMRSCLYLKDLSASLKVNSFKDVTIDNIKNDWKNISDSIENTLFYLNEILGVNAENLVSENVLLPIIYFRYKNPDLFNEEDVSKNTNLFEIKKYIAISQMKHIFGQSTNQALDKIRNKLNETPGDFIFSNLQNIIFSSDITMKFTEDDIDNWFEEYEKGPYTFMLLSFLYPEIKFNKLYHQDHMHPYSSFEGDAVKKLKKQNIYNTNIAIDDDMIKKWKHNRNKMANLQLLIGKENKKKLATPLKKWISNGNPKDKYLPDVNLDITNFDVFYKERKELMIQEIKKQLGL